MAAARIQKADFPWHGALSFPEAITASSQGCRMTTVDAQMLDRDSVIFTDRQRSEDSASGEVSSGTPPMIRSKPGGFKADKKKAVF
jgi:hypothetical protein